MCTKTSIFKVILLTAIEYLRDDSVVLEETVSQTQTCVSVSRGSISQITENPKSPNFLAQDPIVLETVDAWPDQRRQKNRKTAEFAQGLKALGITNK